MPPGNISFPSWKARFKTGDELTAEHAAEHLHRQEESIAWVNPMLVTEGETAGRDHAVDMQLCVFSSARR